MDNTLAKKENKEGMKVNSMKGESSAFLPEFLQPSGDLKGHFCRYEL